MQKVKFEEHGTHTFNLEYEQFWMNFDNDIYVKRKEVSVYWFNKASDLLGSAGALWASMDETRSNELAKELDLGPGFDMRVATYSVFLMLCGMSLELLYKAITCSSPD